MAEHLPLLRAQARRPQFQQILDDTMMTFIKIATCPGSTLEITLSVLYEPKYLSNIELLIITSIVLLSRPSCVCTIPYSCSIFKMPVAMYLELGPPSMTHFSSFQSIDFHSGVIEGDT